MYGQTRTRRADGPMPPPARGSLSTTWTSGIWRDDSVSGSRVIHRGRRSRVKGREEASSASVNYLNASSRGKLCSSVTRKSRIKVVTPGAPVLQGRDPGRSVSASDRPSPAPTGSVIMSGGCQIMMIRVIRAIGMTAPTSSYTAARRASCFRVSLESSRPGRAAAVLAEPVVSAAA